MSVQSVKPWRQSLSIVTWPPHDDFSWCPLFLCFNHKFPIFYSPTSKMCCSWRNLRTHIQWQWHQQKRPLMERLTGMGSEGAVEDVHCYADFCFLFFFWEYILMLNWASEKAQFSTVLYLYHSTSSTDLDVSLCSLAVFTRIILLVIDDSIWHFFGDAFSSSYANICLFPYWIKRQRSIIVRN